jgi:menaquinone-dependent protoporphyrinogen oxidase
MRILVAAASRHGATLEIAEAIGDELTLRGIEANVLPVQEVECIDEYDAIVLGSGVYMGHWLSPAVDFIHRHWDELVMLPVWLFSSGPVGDPLKPKDQPVELNNIVTATVAREHRIFAGRLERQGLGLSEKAICTALRVPEGDFRDWAAILSWADGIAEDVLADAVVGR